MADLSVDVNSIWKCSNELNVRFCSCVSKRVEMNALDSYGIMKMEAICSFETLVTTYRTAQHHDPKDHNPQVVIAGPKFRSTDSWKVN